MAIIGRADREHSGHYLTAVAAVTVIVAGLAWFGQNRTLAAAAAALGIYALHLVSIRFLLENQRRQREVLDAQWEVLQRFLGEEGVDNVNLDELVPAMPVDREEPEKPSTQVVDAVEPADASEPAPGYPDSGSAGQVVMGRLVPPIEALPQEAVHRSPVGAQTAADDGTDKGFPILELEADVEPEFLPLDPEEDEGDSVEAKEPGLVGIPPRPQPSRPMGTAAEVPVPRHFALGTVALVRDLLTPDEVARVLLEQRRQPGKKFGELAVEMGLLSDSQREELLLAQQEGLFTDAEMREARRRLREFRENAAHSLAGLD